MFGEDFETAANAAVAKRSFLEKNPFGYFLLSMLAGMYIGFGVLLAFTVGGLLSGAPAAKLAMGACFGVALSLVVMAGAFIAMGAFGSSVASCGVEPLAVSRFLSAAVFPIGLMMVLCAGAELFTGNNLVMAAGLLKKKTTVKDAVYLWIICWLGNAAGGVLLAALYHLTELGGGAVGEFMASGAFAKMTASPVALVTRGILCNMLVCIAVWCGFRCKTESGKLVMIFWCLLAFFATGFEHSVANMTLLTISLLDPAGQAVSVAGWFYNLGLVTLGNMLGGIFFVAVPYFCATKCK